MSRPPSRPPAKRERVPACYQCTEKHYGCSGGNPCAHCLHDNRGRPCSYPVRTPRPRNSRSSVRGRGNSARAPGASNPGESSLSPRSSLSMVPGPGPGEMASFESFGSGSCSSYPVATPGYGFPTPNSSQYLWESFPPVAGSSTYQLSTPPPSQEALGNDPGSSLFELLQDSDVILFSSPRLFEVLRLYHEHARLEQAVNGGANWRTPELDLIRFQFRSNYQGNLQNAMEDASVPVGVQSAIVFGYIEMYRRHNHGQPDLQFHHDLRLLQTVHEAHLPGTTAWNLFQSQLQAYLCYWGLHHTSQMPHSYCEFCHGSVLPTTLSHHAHQSRQ